MTPNGDRRAPNERGSRRHVWPKWVRVGYRFLTTPRGEKIARILIGLFLFGLVAGWLMFQAIVTIPPARVEKVEHKVEEIEREAKKAGRTARDIERKLDRRLERVEEVITTP